MEEKRPINQPVDNIPAKLLSPYKPEDVESAIYKRWLKEDTFAPSGTGEPFSIVLPPPNVTGTLHIGNALGFCIEDSLIRFNRMHGKKTLWLPGTDHAAIATQSKVEKEISKKEGKSRYDLGRDVLVKRVEKFAKENHDTIVSQLKTLGLSLDWSREAYTLDDKRVNAVKTAFTRMYNAGLIYRGHRIVNWDPKGQTTISDDEIVYQEEKTTLYYLKYGPFTIATARPETKFGDKYIVMHPDDSRYAQYSSGQKINLEWINGPITATVIKDDVIDKEFGTGVMTITPWHSVEDFEIAERHNLDKEQIIDLKGRLLPIAKEFGGMKITEAREKIIEKLKQKGLLIKTEDYTHNVATAERTNGLIEPQILDQWFVAVNKEFTIENSKIPGIKSGSKTTLKEIMRKSVSDGAISINPEYFDKTYFHWIDNLRDWCISRQIWFGHRIPAWYKGGKVSVGLKKPFGFGWKQDEDTLDTWFSSGLWTFSTLGWPDKTQDLKTFHPTSVVETGYDIIFFWVARMIMMSGFFLGEVPFKNVYLHGIVRDKDGRKISKSLGNNLDPADIVKEYGADALRMALLMGTAPGTDSKISLDKIKGQKHFANKLWNISRFVFSNTKFGTKPELTASDEEFLNKLKDLTSDITNDMESFRLHLATEKLYNFAWHEFADVYIEESKKHLASTDQKEKNSAQFVLGHTLETLLMLLHPFIPFVTEEIWSMMPNRKSQLIISKWPSSAL
jgi:valyl-tRNA synthetase